MKQKTLSESKNKISFAIRKWIMCCWHLAYDAIIHYAIKSDVYQIHTTTLQTKKEKNPTSTVNAQRILF